MEHTRVIGDFHTILDEGQVWKMGGFPLPDGSFWEYREPDAVVIVRNGILYARATLSRQNDHIQILDNAKHMYYSVEPVIVPEEGEISFELDIRARTQNTAPNDLYDGYVSLNLLDFTTGAALDFFAGNDKYASVFGILPFPGVVVPPSDKTRFFCIFKEDTNFKAREFNNYKITYNRVTDEAVFYLNGVEIRRDKNIPIKLNQFTIALGMMTEKDLSPEGSVSVHGQTVIAEWSPITVMTTDGAKSSKNVDLGE
ncbi:DUF6081 family protein [Paenibacillus macquariensis]|uniref:Uncharacterized protein n=1 Tax=Paenibacillus macquariensis TaxID=948756 RepID=A0ABY1JRB5_9BACL|nr:DUF6081 family protein [Paenibacillus macquariensis]MEC0092725.1 DUF6081 family protein [Paenibacillus macquariensis]OAB36118.1 hypothetical protein PMSM_06550 [Paenibacillus macquariensis subsp. macquariensis]SIQ64767.1 hypothetical protein SAMN05421578_103165 [Paenibacillus macquariensis]